MPKKFKKDIKEEHKGHEHYEAMAKKYPKQRKKFLKMAEDEERHMKTLKKMGKKKK